MDAGYVAALSGLVGALIGSASSIATIVIQSKVKDRRDRSKQVTDLSLAEFNTALDLAKTQGGGAILPISVYMHNNHLLLEALESGTLTTDRLEEITAANEKLAIAILKMEKARRGRPTEG